MTELPERLERIVRKTVRRYLAKFHINQSLHDEFFVNARGDVWADFKDIDTPDAALVRTAVDRSCVDTWRGFQFTSRHNPTEVALFSENEPQEKDFVEINGRSADYDYRGSLLDDHPELTDAERWVLECFCVSRVADSSRRTALRRKVDEIFQRLGVDSTRIHEYTSRHRRRPSQSETLPSFEGD